ncbi:hypothetical protein HK097_002868, partial [Rhizophlyctis rosea]
MSVQLTDSTQVLYDFPPPSHPAKSPFPRANEPIVIVGGGVIGAAISYYLHKAGANDITIVEQTAIAHAASGKAGGFLAANWCDHLLTKQLARVGFDLHREFAEQVGEESIGYRGVWTFKAEVDEKRLMKERDVAEERQTRARKRKMEE